MQCCPEKHSTSALEHAKWRASFFRSLYASHVAIAESGRDAEWNEKETLYRARMHVAEAGLELLEAVTLVPKGRIFSPTPPPGP
jgi:hypothetical protein